MRAGGIHVFADLFGCDPVCLDDRIGIESALTAAAAAAGATVVRSDVHHFEPFGITGVAVLAESHLAIHTWPEHAYVSVDIFTCGENATPEQAIDALVHIFAPTSSIRWTLRRGVGIPSIAHESARP